MSAQVTVPNSPSPPGAVVSSEADGVTVRRHDRAADPAWDRYAVQHARFTPYHGTAFRGAVEDAFGKPAVGLVATDRTGRLVGVLPMIRQRSRLFGDRLVSMPYANHGGPLADTPQIALRLFDAAVAEAGALGCRRVEVRDHEARELDWPVHLDKVLMTRTLPDSQAALDAQLGAKLRSQCRRASKQGAVVEQGGARLIPAFYGVFAANMRDLGTPVYPRRWFEALAHRLGDAMRLVVVRIDGRPAAGCVLVRWHDTLEIPWAASAREYNRYAVNMLLYREALGHAIDSGCRRFDFGRSTRDSGPWRFKRQWGAQERPIWWRTHPEPGGAGRVGEFLRRAWTRLPLPVANRLGPMISPDLPW
jgi:serine/alanine adding enzyme